MIDSIGEAKVSQETARGPFYVHRLADIGGMDKKSGP